MTAEEFEKHKQEWRTEMAALDAEIAAIKREQKRADVHRLALDERMQMWREEFKADTQALFERMKGFENEMIASQIKAAAEWEALDEKLRKSREESDSRMTRIERQNEINSEQIAQLIENFNQLFKAWQSRNGR
jgi:predicted  nucleic acid-binding Zn-ribbon protein